MTRKPSTLSIFIFAALLSFTPEMANAAPKRITLGKSRVQSVNTNAQRYLCGVPATKWLPVKKVGKKYDLISGTQAHRAACKTLIPRGTIKRLNQLPEVGDLAKARVAPYRGSPLTGSAVSGTPPTIASIPSLEATNLFWRSGVVAAVATGTPTAEQCNEFWGSPVDGESSGQTACFMIQSAGEAFQVLAESGASLCYMRGLPSLPSSAIDLVSGSLPPGGVSKIFDTPTGSAARIIKVDTGSNTSQMLRIFAQPALDASGAFYKFQSWSCSGGEANSAETVTVKINGEFISQMSHRGSSDDFVATVRGFLKASGRAIDFDTAKTRTIEMARGSNADAFKSSIVITSDNEIISRHMANRAGEETRGYSISHFAGTSLADLRFLEGAIKLQFGTGGTAQSFQGGSEYRDTFYGSSPSSDLATRVTAIDIESDAYYGSVSAPSIDLDGFSCSLTPTVRLSLDMSSPEMVALQGECEGGKFENFDMCRSDPAIDTAHDRYDSVCGGV